MENHKMLANEDFFFCFYSLVLFSEMRSTGFRIRICKNCFFEKLRLAQIVWAAGVLAGGSPPKKATT